MRRRTAVSHPATPGILCCPAIRTAIRFGAKTRIEGGPSEDWRDQITVDPLVCHGHACSKGTRLPVSVVLGILAAGLPHLEMLDRYPSPVCGDIHAAIA